MSIDPLTVRELRAHKARQAAERLVVESNWPDSDLVFRTAFGAALIPDTPSRPLPKLIAQYTRTTRSTRCRGLLAHLRHGHATTLLLAGEPAHVVAARLGRADPSVTLRMYAHVIQDLAPAVADSFAEAVSAAAKADKKAAKTSWQEGWR